MGKPNRNSGLLSRLEIAFLVTPAVPAAIFSCGLTLDWSPKSIRDSVSLFSSLFTIAYFVAGAHALILGVPAIWLGRWLNAMHWWTCVPAGLVIGSLPAALFLQQGWLAFYTWGLFGAIGGLAFWLLWRFYVRSDRPVETSDNVPNKKIV